MSSIPDVIDDEPKFSPAGTGMDFLFILKQTLTIPLALSFGLPYFAGSNLIFA